MKTDIRVVKSIAFIAMQCPHCKEDHEMTQREFSDATGDEPCDWAYSKLDCPSCKKPIEVNNLDWD